MTFDERKREAKEQEGDPFARGRRRALHRALLRGALSDVKDASFVVVNPTHVAIALAYRPPEIPVPRITVRSAGEAALRVRALAEKHAVPVVENVALARALHRDGRVGEPIARIPLRRGSGDRNGAATSRRVTRAPVYAFAALLLAVVAILIVPLPPWLLDVLLGINIFASALVLLLSVTVDDPLEFSAFAPALLVATLFRLSLDVSATRLILTDGAVPGAVGAIIPAFGAFVVHGNLVVGLIVFAILVTIQFVVIASGSQRVAEVAARFTLDAMPGKQMAIDADVHAGSLDAEGARLKRAIVQREADFYGAMDGAGKFVKGDAVAALVIVALNLIGGIVVGTFYRGLSPLEALDTFALLSVGNALVTTLPAFLISTAMGMMVTRVASDGALGADLAAQLFARPDVLRCAGGLLIALSFVPALPRPLFFLLGGSAFALGQAAQRRRRRARGAPRRPRARPAGGFAASRTRPRTRRGRRDRRGNRWRTCAPAQCRRWPTRS
jgi:flagellar biosynthesis protein FlhA